MSHPSHIEHMREARRCGFETRLYFVATEGPIINKRRVANRVVHDGHDVPADRVEARYHRTLANLPAAIEATDYAMILDNSLVEAPLRPLAEINRGHLTLLMRDLIEVPFWWLKILHAIKPPPLLEDGKLFEH